MPNLTDQAVDVLSLDPRDYKRPITIRSTSS